ncbi:type I-C CRISPR-associated endonuclease Cas1c [Spirochaeta thermophila]|uniref:CRISPR-associated endonuclease Cas1 n=1 Tax=Winmispira thermophila (strain ATCC 49972 / DSM 6192 / RI 19.B1) TaxID=665571 RepID=E0RPP0_WINT6|nr:type I-C CRISPR-associated endonuclease Cas1c [Spirochaeta thermophila]ADN01354.1 hypothetical protein STHERM_c03820 [Spirochaeta thermophila DSM 6192]
MKRLLNTLFITTEKLYLKKDHECVAVFQKKRLLTRIPLIQLSQIVCFGNVLVSPFLLGHCGKNGISVSFFSRNGRFLARATGPTRGNVLLRREQYRIADSEERSLPIVRAVILAKIHNSRRVLQRAFQDHGEKIADPKGFQRAIGLLQRLKERVAQIPTIEEVRGIEGDASRLYFTLFDQCITSQKADFFFHERSRRPPLDRMNAILSFLYTLLYCDMISALEGVGLDPAVGFLHKDRSGRASLALDLIEELRAYLGDRIALSLVNLGQIKAEDFELLDNGAVFLTEKGRKKVLTAYQQRKQEEITHLFLGEKIPIGLLFYVQGLLLARYIRGDLDGYPAFFWK